MRVKLGISACAAVVFALLSALTACSKSRSPSVGGETNWLVRCSDDDACELGSCLCGVCTRACEKNNECTDDFEGACAGRDDSPATALSCESDVSPAAVCLPRCSSDDACGDDYRCDQGLCIPARAVSGGPPDSGPPPDSGSGGMGGGGRTVPDACVPVPGTSGCEPADATSVLLNRLALGQAGWATLQSNNSNTYWYTEENCGPNGVRDGTMIQITNGSVSLITSVDISECVGSVNRYADFIPRPMEELYDECADLVRREGSAVTIGTDEQGVIERCVWGGESSCLDNCGEGFLIADWDFGEYVFP